MKQLLLSTFSLVLFLNVTPLKAQYVVYGPEFDPPGGLFTESSGTQGDNLIGTASGKDFTFSSIDLLDKTNVFYGTLEDGVRLSLDGNDFGAKDSSVQEILTYDPGISSLTTGVLGFSGSTRIPDQPDTPVYTRFFMTFTVADTAINLVEAESLGLPAYLGAIPELQAGMSLKVNLKFQASWTENSGFEGHIPFYDRESLADGGAVSSYSWGWYWWNAAPEIMSNEALSVNEGDTTILNNQLLMVDDTESDSSEISLVLFDDGNSLPAHGKLLWKNLELGLGDSFTKAQLMKDSLVYVHDGSESIKDSIALRMMDGDGKYYVMDEDSTFYLKIQVTPVDDPPMVINNGGFVIDEGDELALGTTHLKTTDPETVDPSGITYTFDPDNDGVWPKNGILKKQGVPLNSGDVFSQNDIDNGLIAYKHDGSESLSDGFIFKVVDEYAHPAEKEDGSMLFFFELEVTLVNDAPYFMKNIASEANSGVLNILSQDNIAAGDEESEDSEIFFTLVPEITLPSQGVLKLESTVLSPGDQFTMQDIIDGKLGYQIKASSTEVSDKFVFRITDGDGGMAQDGEYTDFQHVINLSYTDIQEKTSFISEIYPNPSMGIFNLKLERAASLEVYDLTGRLVYQDRLGAGESQIDLLNNKEGIYILKLTDTDNMLEMLRIIKK